jgi:hypothetical protein
MSRKRIIQLPPSQGGLDSQYLAVDREGTLSAEKIAMSQVKDYVLGAIQPTSALNFFDFSSNSTTSLSQDVWSPLVTSVTVGQQRNGISVASNGTISYTGVNKVFQFSFMAALIGQTNRKLHIAMFKNGSIWPCSEFVNVLLSANETTIPSQCVIPLVSGDTLQIYVKCSTHAITVTLDNLNVIIKEF